MDKAKQKKPNKQPQVTAKSKQPLKVVYITNPIKIKTSASEFRSLVQELTGKDSDVSASSKFATATADGGSGQGGGQNKGKEANIYDAPRNVGQSSTVDELPPGSEFDPSSLIDEMYTIDDFQGIMGSNLWEQASNFDDHVFRS